MKFTFFNIPSSGHVNPSQAVVRELVARGHHVAYYNTEEMRSRINETGSEFRPYPHTVNEAMRQLDENASTGTIADNALALVEIAEAVLPTIIAELRTDPPDVILHDSLSGWGKQAAEVLGIPSVGIISTFVFNFRTFSSFSIRDMAMFIRDMIVRTPRYNALARRMQKTLGVPTYGLDTALMNVGLTNIIYTSRAFQPAGHTFHEGYKFVGPSIAPRPASDGHDMNALIPASTGDKPVVYVSLGTINNQRADFYRTCFEAFGQYNAHFILSVGKRTNIASLSPIPSNFVVRNFVPQLEVLERADVFITHGGMNSVHEGLWYGVPLIVYPQQMEQGSVAIQVERNGAGVVLARVGEPTTPARLNAALQHILADHTTFNRAAQRLSDSFRQAGGYMRAADELIAYAATTRTHTLQGERDASKSSPPRR